MNYTEIKKLCVTYNAGFDEVESLIMDWGRENKSLQKDIKTLMAFNNNARYPSGYGGMSAGNYLLALILTDSKAIQKLAKDNAAALRSKAKEVLSYWGEHPGFWCYFSIKEKLEGDFLTIRDLLSGEEHLLYSPGICGMQRTQESRDKHYLCLMLGNGECLQTVGILRYNSLSVSDFLFYCNLFEPEGRLDSIINKHYTKFFTLDEISSMPVVMHRGKQVQYTWQEFTLEDFSIDTLGGQWIIKEKGDETSYSLEEPDPSMMDVPYGELLETDFPSMGFTLYRNTKTGQMAINTNALASYSIIAALLQRSYPELSLPYEPEVAISMVLFIMLDGMKMDLPWSTFKTIMEYKEKSKAPESDDLARVNKFLQDYMMAKNTGKSFDAQAYSKKTGMPLDEIERIIESLQKVSQRNAPDYEVPPEDKSFELAGWPVPPPVTRGLFSDSLEGSDLFIFDQGPHTLTAFDSLTGGIYKDEIFRVGVLEFIERLFGDTFGEYDFVCTLANTFFWILFHKGKEWLPARSYAIEALKLFPQPIGQRYPEAEAFIEDFCLFIRKSLCTRGICSLKTRPKAAEVKKGTFLIKGSDAFYHLVEGVKA